MAKKNQKGPFAMVKISGTGIGFSSVSHSAKAIPQKQFIITINPIFHEEG